MRTLVAFYSRSGRTRAIALHIAEALVMAQHTYLLCPTCSSLTLVDDALADSIAGAPAREVGVSAVCHVRRLLESSDGVWCGECNARLVAVTRDMLDECSRLMADHKAFLYQSEMQVLRGLIARLEQEGSLMGYEIEFVYDLSRRAHARAARHGRPRFYRGGNPESGRRSG